MKFDGDSNPKSREKYEESFGKTASTNNKIEKSTQNIESPIKNCDFLIFIIRNITVNAEVIIKTICKIPDILFALSEPL